MSTKITFAELIDKIASDTGATKTLIDNLLHEVVGLCNDKLEKNNYFTIAGLGRFSIKKQAARRGRNPNTGEEIVIPAHNSLHFKAQTSVANHINRKFANLPFELEEKESQITDKKDIEFIKKEPNVFIESTLSSLNTKQEPLSPTEEKASIKHLQESEKEFSPIPYESDESFSGKKSSTIEISTRTNQTVFPKTPSRKKDGPNLFPWWAWLFLIGLFFILSYLLWPVFKTLKLDKKFAPTQIIEAEKKETVPNLTTEASVETKTQLPEKSVSKSELYLTSSGDYYYDIARRHYANPALWPLLFSANSKIFPHPEILKSGKEILLPKIEGEPFQLSIHDKQILAQSYFEVYLYYKDRNRQKAIYHLWVAKELDKTLINNNDSRIYISDIESIKKYVGEINF